MKYLILFSLLFSFGYHGWSCRPEKRARFRANPMFYVEYSSRVVVGRS